MTWIPLTAVNSDETDLDERQLVAQFVQWLNNEDTQLVGVPDWMRLAWPWKPHDGQASNEYRFPLWRSQTTRRNEHCRADMLGRYHAEDGGAENYVFEFKYGKKYEPLAFAEVLHHAQTLYERRSELEDLSVWAKEAPVVPVIVAQHNRWNRAAIHYLAQRLRPQGEFRDAIRLVEVTVLVPSGNEGTSEKPVIWFEEVVDPTDGVHRPKPGARPSELPLLEGAGDPALHWSRVASDCWLGAKEEQHIPPDSLRLVVGQVGKGNGWASWSGTAFDNGSYWLWSSDETPPLPPSAWSRNEDSNGKST